MAVEDVEMPVEIEELYSAFETADNILLKNMFRNYQNTNAKQ